MNKKKYIKSESYRGYIVQVNESYNKYIASVFTDHLHSRGSSTPYDSIKDAMIEGKKIVDTLYDTS